jgi:NitT/TauT family transport system ATP-binding protein
LLYQHPDPGEHGRIIKAAGAGPLVQHDLSPAILLEGVGKTYATPDGEVRALAPTDLRVARGELIVLLGPSGCGKTTLLRLVAGLIAPSTGTIRVAGQNLWRGRRRSAEASRNLGIVFQDSNLFPWYSVAKNIALPLTLRGVAKTQRMARAEELASLVGIAGFGGRWPRELSGGMRQRAALARALAGDPSILLMDEPFGALDALTRDTMNLELQRIWGQTGCTIMLVTHGISEAVFLGDRVVLLSPRPGRIDSITNVDFPRPRTLDIQTSQHFQAIAADLRARLEATS